MSLPSRSRLHLRSRRPFSKLIRAFLAVAPSFAVAKVYKFAVVPKTTENVFFGAVRGGCEDEARRLTKSTEDDVQCIYVGPKSITPTGKAQANITDWLVEEGEVDGIAVSAVDDIEVPAAINRTIDADMPVVTFDSDAPESGRMAYIGTRNDEFGKELGKLLEQLAPEGGTYGIVSAVSPNLNLRVEGIRERLVNSPWQEVDGGFRDCYERTDDAVAKMYELAAEEVDAIIPVGGWPMFDSEAWKEFVDANRHLTLVVADTLSVQLDLMNQVYADALVGQVPYEMGAESIKTLYKIVKEGEVEEEDVFTSFMEMVRFPQNIPGLEADKNYLQNLAILGYVFFAIVAILSMGFIMWTWQNRKKRVVQASQPFFLLTICVGVLIFSSSMISMTIDDEKYKGRGPDVACMCTPWLLSLGFTMTFAALFSKLWRINKIFRSARKFRRIKVTVKDVLLPFALLMAANVIVLLVWTILDPLKFMRNYDIGTDFWNRSISSYGICSSRNSIAFTLPLGIINLGVVVLANFQAYFARNVHTEFNETKYIAVIMSGLLQIFVVGLPVIILISDDPKAFFVMRVCIVFGSSASILLLMFVPKVLSLYDKKRKKMEAEEQRRAEAEEKMKAEAATEAFDDSMKTENIDANDDTGMIATLIDSRKIALVKIQSERVASLKRSRIKTRMRSAELEQLREVAQ